MKWRRKVCAGASDVVSTCHELSEALGTQTLTKSRLTLRWSISEPPSVSASSAIVEATDFVFAACDIDRVRA